MKNILPLSILLFFSQLTLAQSYTILGSGSNAINPLVYIHAIATDATGNVFATGGNYYSYPAVGLVQKWNGTNWAELCSPGDSLKANGAVRTLITDASNNVYVAGDFYKIMVDGFYIAKWNGNSWSDVNNSTKPHYNNGTVFSIVNDNANNIYASEYFDSLSATTYIYVAKWNGTNWSEVGSGVNKFHPDSAIYTLAKDAFGNIYAAGRFTNAAHKKYVAKWNGTAWSELGTGVNSLNANTDIFAVVADPAGNIYASGGFTDTSGKSYVAKWNGTSWTPVGNGNNILRTYTSNSAISSLATDAVGNLYAAGGLKDSIGYYVAKWDGASWIKLHTDTNMIAMLAIDASGIVYGAKRGIAYSGKPANGFVAKLNFSNSGINQDNNVAGNFMAYPNPVNNILNIKFDATSEYEIAEVFNSIGILKCSQNLTGKSSSIDFSNYASGLYILKISRNNQTILTRKIYKE